MNLIHTHISGVFLISDLVRFDKDMSYLWPYEFGTADLLQVAVGN
jgi:hypothetical protein